jgi:hypothetical protein
MKRLLSQTNFYVIFPTFKGIQQHSGVLLLEFQYQPTLTDTSLLLYAL